MITILEGNIFNSKCQTITNTVNCVGAMGKGIALRFKQLYPEMYLDYKYKCSKNLVKVGIPYVYYDISGKNILNFPTKLHWKDKSELSYINDGLNYLINNYQLMNINSLAIPGLGVNLGGLDYIEVYRLMYDNLKNINIPVEIYLPIEMDSNINLKLKEMIMR